MLSIVLLQLYSGPARAFACPEYSPARRLADLPGTLREASGLEMSRRYPRLYHLNDGSGPKSLFITGVSGEPLAELEIAGANFGDTEDLALFSCGASDCLLIPGIGNNKGRKETAPITVIEEPTDLTQPITPLRSFLVRYSDGPRDAEAIAVHPNGDLIVITKEYSKKFMPYRPARIYRARKDAWQAATDNATVQLEFESVLDLGQVNPSSLYLGRLVNGVDISADGKNFVVITYLNAVEFNHDLALPFRPVKMQEGRDYKKIRVRRRVQMEAIAYREDLPGIIYSSENPVFDPFAPFKRRGLLAQVLCR